MRIFDYGKVADWEDRLAVLAEMAEPERWTYISVPSAPPVTLQDHILRENLNRFPVELGGQVDANGVPLDLTEIPDIEEEENEASASAEDGDEVEIDTTSATDERTAAPSIAARIALDGAITHSIRLAQRSYRVAVPQHYRGNIQLLLPLYLRDTARADLALALERHGDWYRAATVLYPDWAYRHARLLSRPNSEWLGGFRTDAKP